MKKIISLLLVLVLTMPSVNVSSQTLQDGTSISVFNVSEDSTFVLSTSDVQVGDDYNPESTDVSIPTYYNNEIMEAETIETLAAGDYVGDPMVYYTQKWLNQEYGDVPGFGTVTENGKTGWNVIYGLTRALQHELGITSLANNFGPTTARLYGENPLQRQDGVTDRKFAILQGALWCKGYNPGYYLTEDPNTGVVSFQEIFNENVENAIIKLKEDAGLINPDGVVTVNVMKALLSMDSFKLLGSYYGGKPEIRAMQQYLNRKYEAYTGLMPCDGVYGRNTNKALIYAFQAEEGLPVSVSSGTFGPTTRSLTPNIPYTTGANAAKNYQGNYYSSNSITDFTELLQFALFIHGFGDGNFNGSFSAETQKAVRQFQQHYALPMTGKVDLNTWMALLVSSGNPARPAIAADCATILNEAKAKTLYDNGYRYIGRYLTGTYGGGISKALTVEEANIILDAGLRFFPIYQTSANKESYFTPEQGTADAQAAIEAAYALGIPKDTVIYFAVDFDALDYQITNTVIPYFEKVYQGVKTSGYKVGIYGARNVCSRVSELGYACSSFVGDMSTGFSGNLGFKIPDNWAFSQFANLEGSNALGSGDGKIEIDKNAFSGRDQGVGRLNKTIKKAIYVLPGYMGSKLFTPDEKQFWVEGDGMDLSLVNGDNIPLVADIAANAIKRKSSVAMQNKDGSGSKLYVDATRDPYGSTNTYRDLVNELKENFEGEYTIEFFPYNWLGDLNDSAQKLRKDIKTKGYTSVVFVTHSTGGLLAANFIAKNNNSREKIKIDKAILIAAPLFGTYSALSPLEIGAGALIGQNYKLVDGFAQAAKTAPLNPFFPSELKASLALVTVAYNAANNWVRDVSHNSPTTYQLLPSDEYLKLMPQLYENDFDNKLPIASIKQFYNVLNSSSNINSNLTNGNNRSHQYFRETVLGGDIVSVLQTVDTLLIASDSAEKKTPVMASYTNSLFGGIKLKEIVYKGGENCTEPSGDGTVPYYSATANDGSGEKLPVHNFSGVSHTGLVSFDDVLIRICNEIKGIKNDASLSVVSAQNVSNESIGMSDLLKINYTADVPVTVKIFDADQNQVAQVSAKDYYGFDDENFIFCSYADRDNISDATVYFPRNGYKLIFQYGDSANVNVRFQSEISTLQEDGLKNMSVTGLIGQTTTDGMLLSLDGTNSVINIDAVAEDIGGVSQICFTEWELPNEMDISFGNTQTVSVTGEQAVQVSPLLQWSSSDEQVVKASASGVIEAVGYGQATLTATDGNKISTCTVTVPQNATAIMFSDLTMKVGERNSLSPTFYPIFSTETDLIYTYDTSSVVSIDEHGVVHALAAGTVLVTAMTNYGVSSSFVITVSDSDFLIVSGDVNDNGYVDIRDLIRLKKHLLGMITLTDRMLSAADLQKDGIIMAQDLILLRQLLLQTE